MIICPAQPFDIAAILNIERQAFIPAIQEKKKVFEKRMSVFPEGFFVLTDNSTASGGTAVTCGYFCTERWDEIPVSSDEKRWRKRFALNHDPASTHRMHGTILYISSFALLSEYRGKGIGGKFFRKSLAALCAELSDIQTVVLLVNSEWKSARAIYEKLGFTEIQVLKSFFPTLTKKECSDGIVMTIAAERFRTTEYAETDDSDAVENPFCGIVV